MNSTGSFLCARGDAKEIIVRKTGVTINIASVSGMIGKDRCVYEDTDMLAVTIDCSAVKGAVINMTRDLACHLAPHNIRVNAIIMTGFERGQPQKFLDRYRKAFPWEGSRRMAKT